LGAVVLASVALAADKPQYGDWGLDIAGMDKATKPGDDFFRFANGAWLDRMQIPPDKSAVMLRLEMTDRTEARLREMLEGLAAKAPHRPSDLEGKIGAFYKAFMDEERIESFGAKPIAPELNAVRTAKTHDELAALMGKSNANFYGSLFFINLDADLKDPKRYSVYLGQWGLGLPGRDYYLKPDFSRQKEAYQTYIAQLLHLTGWPDAEARAKDVVDFETKIAEASWTKSQQRDPVAFFNPMSVTELETFAPGFAWKDFLAAADLASVTSVIAMEKSAFPKFAAIYAAAPIETIKAWQTAHIADNAAPYLSKAFTDASFTLHEKTLAGQAQPRARWKRGITAVAGGDFHVGRSFGTFGTLGFGVGELYSAKYFGPDARAKIEALGRNLRAAYAARLKKLRWMGPATRAEAIKKLESYSIKVGYPDYKRDYSKLAITDDDVVADARNAAAADWAFNTGRLNGPVDMLDWTMTPQTNDAYNGSLQDIVFPAGVLQAPMFDPYAEPAINYGAIGAIIGHELTHGFDDWGRKIDADGALRNWWTKEDATKFDERAKLLVAQYSEFRPLADDPTVRVNGELSLGENMADLGGLTLALDAYHASLHGKPAPVIDGLTGDQRVFLGWAQVWRGKVTRDFVKRQVVSDSHAPRQFRVNGVVRNIDAWYTAFDVKPGDKLYVAPKDRVRIW